MFKTNFVVLLTNYCLLFIACSFVFAAEMQNDQIVRSNNLEGVICTNYGDWPHSLFGSSTGEFWKPSKEEILVGEAAIEKYLVQLRPARSPDLAKKLPEYRCQYLGIAVNGRKRIYYNFYHKDHAVLTDEPVIVQDGGNMFFQIEYDIQDGKCYSLHINGES